MLRFVVHAGHRLTMTPYLERWAGEFRRRVELVSYDTIFCSARLPRCVHVFTDLERLDTADRERAAYLWRALEAGAPEIELLNHPLLGMRRYELLRTLCEAGINDFDVYRLTEVRRPRRFPVFVRGENDHHGPETALLASQHELDAAVKRLVDSGKSREGRIAVEFHAARDADGLYRKYAAFYVAGEVLPRHLMISEQWMVKAKSRILDDEKIAEERGYIEANPHAEWIADVFRKARVDYGRIDYGFVDGKPQAYEINTNPTIIPQEVTERTPRNARFAAALTAAYQRLEQRNGGAKDLHEVAWIPLDPPLKGPAGRMVSRVLAAVAGRQFRRPV